MEDRALTQQRPMRSTPLPDTDREVAGIIARLLLHYFAAGDLSDAARKAMAQDWVDDLGEFGPMIVRDACQAWRRTQSRRPTPADIRALCIADRQERGAPRLAAPSGTDEYARSVGWASEAERLRAIDRDTRRRNEQRVIAKALQDELVLRRSGALRTAASAAAEKLRELGVTAREYTPDELRAGRLALGLEQPEAAQ